MRELQPLATTDALALIVDIDALDRTTLAKGDRVMMLALDALAHMRVQVILVSRGPTRRAAALQQVAPRSRCLETLRAVACARDQMPGVHVIAVSDDAELLGLLGPDDRGITLAPSDATNVVTTGETSVRAVLWWLVDVRSKAGLAARS